MLNPALRFLDLRKVAFLAFFLALLVFITLSDPDYYWHLKTGEYILTLRALPATDIFSYTHHGHPWVLHEWLFEVALYGTYMLGGESGVKLLTALLATLALYVTYATANRLFHRPYITLLLSFIYFIPVASGISPRPQLVTYVLFAVFLNVLLRFKYCHSHRGLFLLPTLMVPWVNSHGGYIVGIALMLLFTGCEWMNYWVQEPTDKEQKRRLKLLNYSTLLVVLASALNPYFVGHWLYPFEVLNMKASTNVISEWLSPNFHSLEYKGYLLLVLGFFVAYIYRETKPGMTELIVPVFFIAEGFISARHIPLAALTAIPFVAMALTQAPTADPTTNRVWIGLKRWYGKWIGGGKQLENSEYVLNWLLLIVFGLVLLISYPIHHAGDIKRINKVVPIKATQFILEAGLTGRMFNTYHFGGYLIYRLYPAQSVFIDGRADMYGDGFMKEYIAISSGRAGWEKTFDKYRIDYAITLRDEPIRQLLLARGDFKLVYDDEETSVLVRNDSRYADIIAKHGLKPLPGIQS